MSIFDGQLKIEVAAARGIEAVVKRELISLGYAPSGASYGRICFEGDFKDVMRANVFLRTANRVRIVLGSFRAETFAELCDGVQSIRWQDILPKDAKIIVEAKSQKSKLFALRSIQSISKKAIISSMQRAYRITELPESGTPYDIEVSIADDLATITLDTSGDGLHKRGYRTYLGDAPLRETLASAMLSLSVWKPDRPLIDPFCGSGTIPIEAALMGLNIASGMNRSFACESFYGAPNVRGEVQQEAEQLIRRDVQLQISGFDINPDAIQLAMKHAERAGVASNIHLQVADMRNLSSHRPRGVIVTNPPYGERLMQNGEVEELYRDFGAVCKRMNDWCVYVITSHVGFEKHFGKRANKVRKLYNSQLECNFYQYLAPLPTNKQSKPSPDCDNKDNK
ncbi:MAG: class I SAM-dependent RNA methyltransferase [Clostridia bacterium]|nr:class I SAM-dependent RNA methyltransferase [Clostridia bacterium]